MDTQQLTNTIMAMSLGNSTQKKDLWDILNMMLIMFATTYIKTVLDYVFEQLRRVYKICRDSVIPPGSCIESKVKQTSFHIENPIDNKHYPFSVNDCILFYINQHPELIQHITSSVVASSFINKTGKIEYLRLPYNVEIRLDHDIFLKLTWSYETYTTETEKGSPKPEYVNINTATLYSKRHYVSHLEEFKAKCEVIYQAHLKQFKKLRITRWIKSNTSQESRVYTIDIIKTFSNLFFESKARLLQQLSYFNTQKEEYARLGRPHHFGLLLYGQPGTGKTSCIKAIAHYLERDVLLVNLKSIKKISTLLTLFTDFPSYIIVFEEIDCSGSNLLLDRSIATQQEQPIVTKEEDDLDALTLGSFLEAMDGMIESSGRICIFTTNYPDRIDKALMRPGRIDLVIEMKKMRKVDVSDMYKLWFNETIPKQVYDKMTDYQFSQAEIGQLFSEYCHDLKQVLKRLK